MTQVETTQNTFGKATKKLVKELAPTAKTFKKVLNGYLIKDEQGVTVATWSPRKMTTGLIVLH